MIGEWLDLKNEHDFSCVPAEFAYPDSLQYPPPAPATSDEVIGLVVSS